MNRKLLMNRKPLIILVILLSLGFMFHNLYYYPVNAGYDASLHMTYAKIVSHQFRLPTLAETREGYNPPFFYFLSGLVGRIASSLSGQDFLQALKAWQYLSLLFSSLSLFFWYQISKFLFPKQKQLPYIFIILLFSIPVFHKTIVMYSIETLFMFLVALTFWYFIYKYLPQPTLNKTIVLALLTSLALLTRISALVLFSILIIGLLGLGYLKRITYKTAFLYLGIFSTIVLFSTGWFWLNRKDQVSDIYRSIPLKQRLSFYTDIPFKYMMTHPFRHEVPLNKFIPIYYSEFWGDYWNYYSQRRFNISVNDRKQDRLLTSPKRIASLALQNQVNLVFTLLIILGFIHQLGQVIKPAKKPKDNQWLVKTLLVGFSLFTLTGFLYFLTHHGGWKGDSIKASYTLFLIPILILFAVDYLFNVLRKKKFIFLPVLIWISFSTVLNLCWGWY